MTVYYVVITVDCLAHIFLQDIKVLYYSIDGYFQLNNIYYELSVLRFKIEFWISL